MALYWTWSAANIRAYIQIAIGLSEYQAVGNLQPFSLGKSSIVFLLMLSK